MNGRMGWGVNGEGEWGGGGVERMGGKGNREDSLERVGKGLKVAVVGFIVLTSVFTNTRRGQFFSPVYLATTKRVCPAKNVWVRQIAEEQAYDLPVLSG